MSRSRKFRKSIRHTAIAVCLILATALWLNHGTGDRQDSRPISGLKDGSAQTRASAIETEMLRRIEASPASDYPSLMRSILLVKDPRTQQSLIASLMRRWLETDMESFTAFLDDAEVEGEQIWSRLTPGFLASLDQLSPETAGSYQLRDLVTRIISRYAVSDPLKALAAARQHLTENNLDSALAAIATELVKVDPAAAIALVSEVRSMANRMDAATGVGLVIGETDPEFALSWVRSLALESEQAFALSAVLTGMTNRDVTRAAEEYQNSVEEMKEAFRERVLAEREASGTSTEEEYEGLTAEEILKAELAKPNPNLIYMEKAAYAIGSSLAQDSPQAALDWARSLDISQGRVVAMEAVFEEWAGSEPEAAFRNYLLEPARRPELMESIFGTWAAMDAAAASTAALSLVPGLERDFAVEGVARGRVEAGDSLEQIAGWSDELASASEKDRVRAVVASEASFDNPVFAWEQIRQMGNNAKRAELFGDVFPSLVENNPKVARSALSSIRLSQVETEYFETMLER
ncbi:hypothetical protein JIN84_13325 [Luteolibacter yonseiensis]|uniref:Uncharacterized protein n=1 Tax=Luteolibacter yonseiensis TaxID=1144680 RepID=A0A934R5H1_9BACT|nr:hypothetical protein [Luteolibacter yonseiensis]MBK1816601.1 hypothetical protein [Luteolibacter yonseiensis]